MKKTEDLVGKSFEHPYLNISFRVTNIADGVATMTRNEFVVVEDLKKWKRYPEFDGLVAKRGGKEITMADIEKWKKEPGIKYHETKIGDLLRMTKCKKSRKVTK